MSRVPPVDRRLDAPSRVLGISAALIRGPHTRPTRDALRALGLTIAACVLAVVNGGCGQGEGGILRSIGNVPALVTMEKWDMPASSTCKGWLLNTGQSTARDVRVHLWYSTARGESAIVVTPSSTSMGSQAWVSFSAPPQVTRGVLRFPRLGGVSWAGGDEGTPGDGAPRVWNQAQWCLLGSDSTRGWVHNSNGLAYHTVLSLETATGTVQVSLKQEPFGRLVMDPRDCPPPCACVCDGYCTFNAPVRDSAGIKLRPKILSIRWEDYAGVADSLLQPYYYPDEARFDGPCLARPAAVPILDLQVQGGAR